MLNLIRFYQILFYIKFDRKNHFLPKIVNLILNPYLHNNSSFSYIIQLIIISLQTLTPISIMKTTIHPTLPLNTPTSCTQKPHPDADITASIISIHQIGSAELILHCVQNKIKITTENCFRARRGTNWCMLKF